MALGSAAHMTIQIPALCGCSGGNYGGVGGATAPPIQQDSEIFAVEVGNFEGGIEDAMKKRVAVEKEKQRVYILNEQTKCSRSICNIFLSFYALTFLS